VINKNEWDISVITIYFHSVPVISVFFYMNGNFSMELNEIEWLQDFLKSRPTNKNGTGIGKNKISLMLGCNHFSTVLT
jgi:hypothetical protein